MRHDLARERTLAVAAAVEAGEPCKRIAKRFGITPSYVYTIARNFEVSVVAANARATNYRLQATIRELHTLEIPQWRVARFLGITQATASKYSILMGLKFNKAWGDRNGQTLPNKARAEAMAALYRDGFTLDQIGKQYGITRERVRQILGKYKRMNGRDGGRSVLGERGRVKRANAKDARAFARWGCCYADYRRLLDFGREMMAAGKTYYQTPLGAYRSQERNARLRKIGWKISLAEWWSVWTVSGHWGERGRGQGYVMCRKGDEGPYAVGNVFIATAAENTREGQRKRRKLDLPMGVKRLKGGRFGAHRQINGKTLNLGTHATPELAYAAYLMAGQPQQQAA